MAHRFAALDAQQFLPGSSVLGLLRSAQLSMNTRAILDRGLADAAVREVPGAAGAQGLCCTHQYGSSFRFTGSVEFSMSVVSPQLSMAIRELVAQATGLEVDEIDPTASMAGDLGIDSLSIVDIAVRCEDTYGVRMDDGVMAPLTNTDKLAAYIAAHATRGLPEA